MMLTPKQGLRAAMYFLETYVRAKNPPDHFLGDLLGETLFLSNGSTADPAAFDDWLDAVEKICGKRDMALPVEQVFGALREFIDQYGSRLRNRTEIDAFLGYLDLADKDQRIAWDAAVKKAGSGV